MTLPSITATGRLGADPELKFTQSGKAVTNFRIACDKRKNENGEWKTLSTVWLSVSLWENDAEAAAEHLAKGDLVTVVGQLNVREYDRKDGTKGQSIEIDYGRVSKALPRSGGGNAQRPAQAAASNPWETSQASQGGAAWGSETPPF